VCPDYVEVDYVRAVLPEDEPLSEDGMMVYNGQVSYSYHMGLAGSLEPVAGSPPRHLLEVRPNPFAGSTQVGLGLSERGRVSIRVYDVEGRLVTILFDGILGEGRHEIHWENREYTSEWIEPGIYFVRVKSDRETETRKALLIR
jgi:hypothetical protein